MNKIKIITIIVVLIIALLTVILWLPDKETKEEKNKTAWEEQEIHYDDCENIVDPDAVKKEGLKNKDNFVKTELTFKNEPQELSKHISNMDEFKSGIKDYLIMMGYTTSNTLEVYHTSLDGDVQAVTFNVPDTDLRLSVIWYNDDISTVEYDLLHN
jgi:flagellar basal body-associated protein FliL